MLHLTDLREILRYVPLFRDRIFVIAVDGALTLNPGRQPIRVGSNKTIDGGGKLNLTHDWVGFDLGGARNVIIRNVRFRGSGADLFPEKHTNCAHPTRPTDVEGCGVSIQMWGATSNVWIDRRFVNDGCTLTSTRS